MDEQGSEGEGHRSEGEGKILLREEIVILREWEERDD